jgi:hypothetical protein
MLDKSKTLATALRHLDELKLHPVFATPVPLLCISPLDPATARAADEAGEARGRLDERIAKRMAHPAPRGHNCGRGRPVQLEKPDLHGGIQFILFRPPCHRWSCPYCRKQRILKSYRRAATCLLDAEPWDPNNRQPRLGPVYVAECAWKEWESTDKAMRRQNGGECGRLRVRRDDDTVLIVSEQNFRGAKPVTPAEALDAVLDAIDRLNHEQHSFRLLGRWSDAKPAEWKLVGEYDASLDIGQARKILAELGARNLTALHPSTEGLFWSCANEVQADTLTAAILALQWSCPTSALGASRSSMHNSDTPDGIDIPEDWLRPEGKADPPPKNEGDAA